MAALLAGHGMNGLSKVLHIATGDSRDGDSTVSGAVDVELVPQTGHLHSTETRVAEHTGLIGDVFPRKLGADVLEVLAESSTHPNNAA
jgi:hypothetical protein